MATRQRLDRVMVERGLVPSRTKAEELIAANLVIVGGAVANKPARMVAPGEPVEVVTPMRFVSRGGEKLDAALAYFDIDVSGKRVLDAGASTGGFSDCLLQRGAASVVAVDVGHGQLHPTIRHDGRVTVHERLHVRDLTQVHTGGAVDAVVADLSFISLQRVLDPLLGVCRPGADVVLLVKPQFEAGRVDVSRGRGVVRDPVVHQAVCDNIDQALRDKGCSVHGWMTSPITGGEGNVEFLVYAHASDH
jgi:23S rRNA (cytidine1920-2'-O)/16S rRNA (cytidine1409-2'-O)-methyltransferase